MQRGTTRTFLLRTISLGLGSLHQIRFQIWNIREVLGHMWNCGLNFIFTTSYTIRTRNTHKPSSLTKYLSHVSFPMNVIFYRQQSCMAKLSRISIFQTCSMLLTGVASYDSNVKFNVRSASLSFFFFFFEQYPIE